MAPYHAVLDNQGTPTQRPPALGVRKDVPNAAPKPAAPTPRRDWQAGTAATSANPPRQAPTIRVIHIFAPKVIKTDTENFRSTVQKLTGRSTKKRGRSARTQTQSGEDALQVQTHPPPAMEAPAGAYAGLWDQQERRSPEQVLHQLVGDACGVTVPVLRSSSVESSTYSLDSGNLSSDSNETSAHGVPSPTAADSFSFYVPHRESAYSLSEIPAPFFGLDMHPSCYNHSAPVFGVHGGADPHGLGLQLPTPVMESMLGFDVDTLGPLPLPSDSGSDIAPFSMCGGSSGGGLYDILSVQQHCRLSVQQPSFQGGNFFEMI